MRISCTAASRPGGCGSFTVPGTKITRIVFDVARFALGGTQTAALDGYALGVTATATPDPKVAGLSIAKVVDKAAAAPGDVLDYTITVRNTGEAEARQVPVTDTLPAGLRDATADQGGVVADGAVAWTIDALPAGGTSTLHVSGTVDRAAAGTTLVNRAVVENAAGVPAETPAPTSSTPCADDASVACASTVVAALPALSLAKTVDKQVAGHDEALSYTLIVGNAGTAPATDVPVTDVLPPALTAVSADQGGVVADGAVHWTLPRSRPAARSCCT